MSDNPERLPGTTRPNSYRIELSPDLDAATFAGSVDISIDVASPVDALVLNAVDLHIDVARLDGTRDLLVELDPATERVTFTPDEIIQPGTVELHVEFRGELNDKLVGFYRSTFDASDPATGETTKRNIAVTQFESTHARRAFPCFDEPDMKATFQSSLIIEEGLFAVSNGAEVSRSRLADGRVRIEFAQTMVMSTYLVAFVVGPLEATEPRIVDGMNAPIPLRVVYPSGNAHLCDFALDVAEAGLKFYENYYGIPYPSDKVDLVAVPDFAFGAMENLGCITFREVLLLVDPAESTQPELQRVADVINHELAHMWFGDLVTMKWWNGIWLNEAFATFMELMASDAFRPDWDVWTSFGLARTVAFDTDALHSTRPIEFKVDSPADAEAMFDILTYEKGASVVRMLEQYLGAETFRKGISSYLKSHAYSTTETSDLWDSLESVSGEPVRQMMETWIFQGGHPSVTVEATGNGIRVSQNRFSFASTDHLRTGVKGRTGVATGFAGGTTGAAGGTTGAAAAPDGASSADRTATPHWLVPLKIRARVDGSAAEVEVSHVLDGAVEIDLGGRPSVVTPNVGGNGFYRTSLSGDLREALATDQSTSALERFMLLDDTCAALYAGTVGYDDVWTLITAMIPTEMDPSVWRRIGSAARDLDRLGGDAGRPGLRRNVIEATSQPLQKVNRMLTGRHAGDGPPDVTKLEEIRGVLLVLRGCVGADARTRGRAREVFNDDEEDPSLMAAAIEVVAESATQAEHSELERRWRQAGTPQESLRYLTSLVDTDQPGLFDHALNLTLDEVRTQNAPYLLRRALSNPVLGPVAWEFIRDNWTVIIQKFPSNSLPRMLEGVRSVTDPTVARSVQSFVGSTDFESGGQTIDQHLERMWVTVAAAERVRESMA